MKFELLNVFFFFFLSQKSEVDVWFLEQLF